MTDACLCLLEHGVAPETICSIVSRDARLQDLLLRLDAARQLLRLDPEVMPTMCRCATMGRQELSQLRRIDHAVQLGRVQRKTRDHIVLAQGTTG